MPIYNPFTMHLACSNIVKQAVRAIALTQTQNSKKIVNPLYHLKCALLHYIYTLTFNTRVNNLSSIQVILFTIDTIFIN